MNQLLQYNSDSDENGSSDVTKKVDLSAEVESVEGVECMNVSSPTGLRERKRRASGFQDYFKLSSSSDDEEQPVNSLFDTKTVDSQSSSVTCEDLPSLSFWNDDTKVANVQIDTERKNASEKLTNRLDLISTFKNTATHTTDNSSAFSDSKVKGYICKSKTRNSPTTVTKESLPLTKSPTKMLGVFRVHEKVAPVLNQEHACFCAPKKLTKTLSGHMGAINRIKWCAPQFSHIIASASMDKKICLWNIFQESSNCIKSYDHHKKAVTDVTWSGTGKKILSCSYDKTAVVIDVESGCTQAVCEHQHFVTVGRYHPVNLNYFITGTLDKLCCWDMRNTVRPAKTYVYKDKFGQVKDLVFSEDGSQFFTCNDLVSRDSADKNIMAWDFNKHVVISNQIYQERFTCTRLKVHPTKEEFLAQSQGGYIAQFSTCRPYKMNKCKRFETQKIMGYNIGFDISLDGHFIVSGSADGNVHVYNYHNAKTVQKINLGERTVCLDIACHPVLNSIVAVSTWDGEISILK